jgi:site-specific recombinase XerD
MNELFEKFLRECGLTRSAETMRCYRWNMQQFSNYLADNNLAISEVIKDNLEQFLLQCSSFQLRKVRLRLVKRFYNYLNRSSVDPFNPAAGIKLLNKINRRIPPVPGRDKVEKLAHGIESSHSITSVRNHLMLELAYGSGLRHCELMSLNIEDISISGRTARIQGKGSKTRMVPLTAKTLQLMEMYLSLRKRALSGPPFLSCVTGRRLTNIGISKAFGINIGIRPHLLRHACATHMLDNGCDIRFIQQLLGHKHLTVTQVYTKVSKKKLAEVINRKHPSHQITGEKLSEEVKKRCK